ncbi:MAG: hypothetical protein ACYC27_15570 [Armatimonadota bacterium]
MSDQLQRQMGNIGKTVKDYCSPDGTRLVLLPYGGRILGMYSPVSDENFFWTNPVLCDPQSGKAMYKSDGWHNSGGERTWLSPELDIFYPNYPDTSVHCPPVELDACEYDVSINPLRIQMSSFMTVRLARSGNTVQFSLSKAVSPAFNPLRRERSHQDLACRVEYAGCTQNTSLEFTLATLQMLLEDRSDMPTRVALWNLIQMPHGGEVLVPTYHKTEPRVLFGEIPAGDLLSDGNLVRYKIRASGEQKIAVRAVATTGRAGYLYPASDGRWSLVIRNFFVNPSGEYVDVPKDDPEDMGYSFNAVNVDSTLGKFCELEYHTPAVGQGTWCNSYHDISQIWAFRGSYEDMQSVARILLSTEI